MCGAGSLFFRIGIPFFPGRGVFLDGKRSSRTRGLAAGEFALSSRVVSDRKDHETKHGVNPAWPSACGRTVREAKLRGLAAEIQARIEKGDKVRLTGPMFHVKQLSGIFRTV